MASGKTTACSYAVSGGKTGVSFTRSLAKAKRDAATRASRVENLGMPVTVNLHCTGRKSITTRHLYRCVVRKLHKAGTRGRVTCTVIKTATSKTRSKSWRKGKR